MNKRWLKDWPWATVVSINAGLCKESDAFNEPISKGYKPAEKLWKISRARELTLRETFEVCRKCHQLSPFCFYNGNTFAAIGRTIIQDELRKMPPVKAQRFRSGVGHYIAGTIDEQELNTVLVDLE